MKTYKLNIIATCTVVLLLMACKKEDKREELPEGLVTFDLPATQEVVEHTINIKEASLLTFEMKATLPGAASSDTHYITFAPDTTKIANYKLKYGSTAILLPAQTYLYYKQNVAIPAGSNVSEAAVLNLGFQTLLRPRSTYVLPLAITSVDGKPQDPVTRKVVYYVFKTGDALYVDHTGYTLIATASSISGANTAARAVDVNNATTYWNSATTVSLPQWLNIDYGREFTFTGLDIFFPTAVNYVVNGGDPTSAKVETSSNGTTWVDKGTYSVNVRNTDRKSTIILPSPTTARYLRFTVLAAAPYVAGAVTYSLTFVSGMMLRN